MAIFYSRAKTIGVKQGSIVKAAAYRSGQTLKRQKTGEVANYSRKQGVIHTEIIAPDNAPAWAKNRSELWNKVEATENRKDARFAREIILALPHELTREQNIILMQAYVRENFTPIGMVADFAIHVPDPEQVGKKYKADQRNIHAHILLTDRPLDGNDFAKLKDEDWNKKKHVNRWRKNWATILNDAFEVEGLEQRFDHRSYKKQGTDLIPQVHEGKIATSFRREGKKPDPEQFSEIAAKIEHNDLVREHNQLVQDIEEERRRRKPDKDRDINHQSTDLEHSKRSSIPTTSGNDVDAVQKTAQLDTPSAPAKVDSESAFAGVEGKSPSTAILLKRDERQQEAQEAIRKAVKTRITKRDINKVNSPVIVYRMKLADLIKDKDPIKVASSYQNHHPSALECDRLIRAYMRRRGFSQKQIDIAMRRASPALYRKSVPEAKKYARKFQQYAVQYQRKESEKKRQNTQKKQRTIRRL